jgi:hypothetical protein
MQSSVNPVIKTRLSHLAMTATSCPTHTLLERLWRGIIPRNTVTSLSKIGRLGMAWLDYGVVITGSRGLPIEVRSR